MTPLARWWRNAIERHLSRFYEGPVPPRRLAEMVAHFAEHNPRATRAQWGGFAISLVEESYRSGFARGFERAERDPEPPWRAPLPSEPDLPWSPESVVDCLDEVVPDRVDPDERLQARLMEETKR